MTTRITSSLAGTIANKMIQSKLDHHKKLIDINKELTVTFYKSLINKNDLKFVEDNKDFIHYVDCIVINGNGLNYEYIYLQEKMPYIPKLGFNTYGNDSIIIYLNMTNNSHKDFSVEYNANKKKASDYKKEVEQLNREIVNALMSFKTTKKARENFPDCVPFLPLDATKVMLPMVQVGEISKKLKTL